MKYLQHLFIIAHILGITIAFGQGNDTTAREQNLIEVRIDDNFDANYQKRLAEIRRTYPLALHAKKMIDKYEADLVDIKKKSKRKKYGKKAHKSLKEEFNFNIKDLYVNEGDLLMRLIHRETGMTVSEIIGRYRGKMKMGFYSSMAKIWGHDLKSKYDPKGEDWLTELIIKDIEAGHIPFNQTMHKMDKAQYKSGMRLYRANRKKYKKANRKAKRMKRRKKS